VYARVSTLEGAPEQIDEGLRYLREQVLPSGKTDPGFKGLIALGDRQSGKTLSITFWESEETMRASEEDANQLRGGWAEMSGQEISDVGRYEVGLFEVES
jgi:heme-degrading monooxygenase HmoA